MSTASVNFEVAEELGTQTVLGEHALNGVLNELAGLLGQELASGLVMTATGVTGVRVDYFTLLFVASQDNLLGVDNNNVVTAVNMRSEIGLVFAPEQLSNFRSQAAEDDVLSVDEQPLLVNGGLVGRHGLVA